MADDISKVAKNALRHFADVLHPEAICIRTPLPKRTPLSACKLPAGVQAIIEQYERKVAKEGLFAHQAAFLKAFLHEGKKDFIITTATGSGKSLCFWAWVFECLRRSDRGGAAGRDSGIGGMRSAAGEGAGQERVKMCAKCNRQGRGCRPAQYLSGLAPTRKLYAVNNFRFDHLVRSSARQFSGGVSCQPEIPV
ncbi:MAG: hypothetical protein ABR915_04140 [Thermoguttaceae bacterium]|jgi:hypothetical protein